MASGSVSVRLPGEVITELEKVAQGRKEKVSDVVRQFILSGLQCEKSGDNELLKRIERLEVLSTKAAMAAGKAQFLASLSVGFCADVTKLLVSNETPTSDEKAAFLDQTNEWAEDFARAYLKHDDEK